MSAARGLSAKLSSDESRFDRTYFVGAGYAGPLGQALPGCGEWLAAAICDGRVFVDGVRVQNAGHPVTAGFRIDVRRGRKERNACQVLAVRRGLVAVFKPAGMPTEADRRGALDSVVSCVPSLLEPRCQRVHAATRLDSDVSGVVVLATSKEACRHLERIRRAGSFNKLYGGIAGGIPSPRDGEWTFPLSRQGRGNARVAARTRYCTAAVGDAPISVGGASAPISGLALLALQPVTGRFHQLRKHCSAAGVPLLGDAKHGGARRVSTGAGRVIAAPRVALHAARVELPDIQGEQWNVECPWPAELVDLWLDCGGRERQLQEMIPSVRRWLESAPRIPPT